VLRAGNDKLRASYYMTRIVPEFTYLREAFDHTYPHRRRANTVATTALKIRIG
jgi:hypothetical protein